MDNHTDRYPQRRLDDRSGRRLRKGMYILPSIFTCANVLLGYYAILQVIHGAIQFAVANATQTPVQQAWHFDNAAKAIGFAVLFDGLDGRIARMTGTTSDFGRELDSLADVITFGIAPALLAWAWGFHQISADISRADMATLLPRLGAIASFLFLIAGASRLARFNISGNPQPSNPGRPGKKYFVGMPIPAGAGVIAAAVHFQHGEPLPWWGTSLTWLVVIVITAYLMVSTWRFYSFKDINLHARQPFRLIVIFGLLLSGILLFSGPVLLFIALTYMFSGIFWRLHWTFRRRRNPPPPPYTEASQVS
ncbi:MAG TPA: phosphatidylcholine/phosphatidylserine synthase [Terriglobales bacterium]|nr:phosphatidylcholine/phosphatidylserine synthase [Terriglobales bacterium]